MKNTILLLICIFWAKLSHAQVGGTTTSNTSTYLCLIKYQYDANGNRTNRAYTCEWYGGYATSRTSKPSSESSSVVFPNPNTGVFKIATTLEMENATVYIKTMQGQVVAQYIYNGIEQEFNIKNIPVGQYIIELVNSKTKDVHKIIKQ